MTVEKKGKKNIIVNFSVTPTTPRIQPDLAQPPPSLPEKERKQKTNTHAHNSEREREP